jgi:signal transduction histidine kinase
MDDRDTPSKPIVSQAIVIRRMAATIVVINLLVMGLAGLSLRQNWIQHKKQAAVTTQNLSQVLERYISGFIDKIDVALLTVADEIEKQVAGGGSNRKDLDLFIARQYARLPELDGLRMANAQGDITCGTGLEQGVRANIADREYFIRLRNNPQAKLVISKPVVGRISGKWVVMLARRLNKPDGSFNGTVYGVINLESFLKVFAAVDVGKHGSIALRDESLGLVARYPEPQDVGSAVGQRPVSSELLEQVRAGRATGTFITQSPQDKVEGTYSYRRINGYPLYILVGLASTEYLAGWRDEAIKTSVMVAFFFLITLCLSWLVYRDWKREQAAARDMTERLEHLVQERTGELRVAMERAEAANVAKDDFLSSVSHELRTPMTSVFGFVKLIKKKMEEGILPNLDAEDKRTTRNARQILTNLDVIESEGERLIKLINDVLDLSNLDAGRVDWHFATTDLSGIAKQVMELSREDVARKGLSFDMDMGGDLPPIYADHDRLEQVFSNLVSNAVKFTEQGGITISARLHDNEIMVSVADTGIGIAPDNQDKVFDKFQQIGDTLTSKPPGTGLGLFICKEIVNRHGGRIWVESNLGAGSVFRFTLPVTAHTGPI